MTGSRKDTWLLCLAGGLGLTLAVALAAGVLTSTHVLCALGIGLVAGLYAEFAPEASPAASRTARLARSSTAPARLR